MRLVVEAHLVAIPEVAEDPVRGIVAGNRSIANSRHHCKFETQS